MKKILICLLTCISVTAFSQGSLPEGGKRINAGFGFSNFGLPIYLGLDYGIHPDITLGPQISFRNYNDRGFGFDYDQTLIVIGVNGDYHFNSLIDGMPDEFDVYAGVLMGYYIWSDPQVNGVTVNNIGESSGIGLGVHVGGRYFFTPQLAINLEFGGGTASGGKIGITYQF